MAKDKEAVEVEPEEMPPGQQTLGPYGIQDMNVAVEPDIVSDGIDEDVERVLTDEVHIDMGRGALTFKPGDTITIRDGAIIRAITREGMEYEFTPAHQAAKQRFEEDQEAAGKHLAAGQALDDIPAPAQPPDVSVPVPSPEEADKAEAEAEKEQPREKGKFAKKGD